jgi:class 3 adenylate cyclase
MGDASATESHLAELRLFIEDICCDLALFDEVIAKGRPLGVVHIDREFPLGRGNFADIRVAAPDEAVRFIEVKVGYSNAALLKRLKQKYGVVDAQAHGSHLIVVLDFERRADIEELRRALREAIAPELSLELWGEPDLRGRIRDRLGVELDAIGDRQLLDVRDRFESLLGLHAFEDDARSVDATTYRNDPLRAELLWHLGAARIRAIRREHGVSMREILPPRTYRSVATLICDLSAFSSFVRDTREPDVVRESLTSFYTKSRHQIVNGGGMLYQFVGDAVLAFFGLPDGEERAASQCLAVSRALLSIGDSVAHHWQSRIDRVQPNAGVHIGLTIGDVELMSLRPFSRTRIGAVSDSINVAARLLAAAGPGEIVASNSFVHRLSDDERTGFEALEPLEARNVGRIMAWRLGRVLKKGGEAGGQS